ncbi:MAG: zinc ribbon domain-containing protein [Desulfobacterales bacterium]|nr:MAG: zinc ribbon domain-containing protein [Desulfobacterales bacterium]
MFLIAGIAPKTRVLDTKPQRCPICGLHQAYYKRMDHYLSFFFIPVVRVKKGEAFLMCDRCERTISEFGADYTQAPRNGGSICGFCGRNVEKNFTFCPHCGKRL